MIIYQSQDPRLRIMIEEAERMQSTPLVKGHRIRPETQIQPFRFILGGLFLVISIGIFISPTLTQLNHDLQLQLQQMQQPNYGPLQNHDLIDDDLICHENRQNKPWPCDFQFPRVDASGNYSNPSTFYTFQAGVFISRDGPGVVVRIKMRDLCCISPGPLPVSYFRVTAYGTAQAASNPPLSLGSLPTDLGRGHQSMLVSEKHTGSHDIRLTDVDEERVLQTFLLLPDPGSYLIQVRLCQYNVSESMITENYYGSSVAFLQRPGLWINELLRNSRDELWTNLTIPNVPRPSKEPLPICGLESNHAQYAGVAPVTGERYGMPLAGRWVYQNQSTDDPSKHITTYDQTWLVEHSHWTPYFCHLNRDIPYAVGLESVAWLHFTGDSNIRRLFLTTCEVASGTIVQAKLVPQKMDPPWLCVGPSSPDNRPDKVSGAALYSAPRWIITYTGWFWDKVQGLRDVDFRFRYQCDQFLDANLTVQPKVYHGWPGCKNLPERFQNLPGPSFTYYGWGSHAAQLGAHVNTSQYLKSEAVFGLEYFKKYPTLFALTTANKPTLIPPKFGAQFRIRNNERVHAVNLYIADAVTQLKSTYPTYGSSDRTIIPIFDLFSPTHAQYEILTADAVHFIKHCYLEQVRWLMHYLYYADNWKKLKSAPGPTLTPSAPAPQEPSGQSP